MADGLETPQAPPEPKTTFVQFQLGPNTQVGIEIEGPCGIKEWQRLYLMVLNQHDILAEEKPDG
ncbi:MAG: hypothetical protein OXC11_02385 [Rhodospirillales bacterium]|nr:hypothetical protein [Rhodospirillales bacterium]